MDLADDIRRRLQAWAAGKKAIRTFWLFGSRARGDAHAESDFDFAIELKPKRGDHDWAFGDFVFQVDQWKRELASIVGADVDLVAFRDDLEGPFDPRVNAELLWPALTYRLSSPDIYRISFDGVEVGSVSKRADHIHHLDYWSWGVDTMPRMDHGGRVPNGRIDPPGGLPEALAAFKQAFVAWHTALPAGLWELNRDHMRRDPSRP